MAERGGEAKLFLRIVTISGAKVFRFPDTPILGSRVSDDIDADFDLNHMISDSSPA